MIEKVNPKLVLQLKKVGYWMFLLPVVLPVATWYLIQQYGYANWLAWFPVLFVFGILPVLDYLVGQDPVNPDEESEVPALNAEKYYRFLTLMVVPLQLFLTIGGAIMWLNLWDQLNLLGHLGWRVSIGLASGSSVWTMTGWTGWRWTSSSLPSTWPRLPPAPSLSK